MTRVTKTPAATGRSRLTRGELVSRALVATGVVAGLPDSFLRARPAEAAPLDVVLETYRGLVAFVVPGPDAYSVAQGQSTVEPGGVDAGAAEALAFGLDLAQAGQPTLAANVAGLLNGVALAVDPGSGAGGFASPFANLLFTAKATVFAVLEGDPAFAALRSLTGLLPALAAFVSYSEAGVFDPSTRTLAGTPVGWTLTSYAGPADGHDELLGYFENRRKVDA